MMSVFSLRTLKNSSAGSPCTELLQNMKVNIVKHEKLTYITLSHAHVLFVKNYVLWVSLVKNPKKSFKKQSTLMVRLHI